MSPDEYGVRGFGLWFNRAKNIPIFSKHGAPGTYRSWWSPVGTMKMLFMSELQMLGLC